MNSLYNKIKIYPIFKNKTKLINSLLFYKKNIVLVTTI